MDGRAGHANANANADGARLDLDGKIVLLYDGVCGLCQGSVRFVLARDRRDRFRFSPLDGELARAILARHAAGGADRGDGDAPDTVVAVVDPGAPTERLALRGAAVRIVLREIGGVWRAIGAILAVFPAKFVDFAYDVVARRRYRWFGKLDACPLPPPGAATKFV